MHACYKPVLCRQNNMKIQHLTDLHLDINRRANPLQRFALAPEADIIALTGDIYNHALDTLNFIKYTLLPQTLPHQHLVFVLGNHEFYGHHWTKLLDEMREAAVKYDVHFLEADEIDIGGIRFLGCSLACPFSLQGTGV